MAMVMRARTLVLAVALCLLGAAPAHAAFFPDLTVGFTPATAGTTPALDARVTQPATDTPIERFTLALPAGFTAAGAPGASVCGVDLVKAGACPADSRIGLFRGQLGPKVAFDGAIHKTGPDSFGFFVGILGGAVGQVVQGTLTPRANGALDMKLDRLPALPISELSLRLWGGPLSLIRTPAACGTYTLDGKFTSRSDELAIDRTLVPVTGCAGVPLVTVANVRMTEKRFKASSGLYSTRTVIAWWASKPVDHTDLRIERRVNGAWRLVGVLVATGNAGDNFVRWDGRLKNRALKPGAYAVRVQPAGSEPAKLMRFRIVR